MLNEHNPYKQLNFLLFYFQRSLTGSSITLPALAEPVVASLLTLPTLCRPLYG